MRAIILPVQDILRVEIKEFFAGGSESCRQGNNGSVLPKYSARNLFYSVFCNCFQGVTYKSEELLKLLAAFITHVGIS